MTTTTSFSLPPLQERHIRIFLSSTFRDMEAERDHLVQVVFPEFRQKCLRRQVTFTEIDLRWGVTEEEAQNGQTVAICLQEIEKCRALGVPPFFLGFLGERYGWVPRESDLAQYWRDEERDPSPYAEDIRAALAKGISVTELEINFGFLNQAEDDALASRVAMLFRDPTLTEQLRQHTGNETAFHESDPEAIAKQQALKAAIRTRRPDCVRTEGYTTIEQFGDEVKRFLMAQLDQLFPADQQLDAEVLKTQAHAVYALSRLSAYVAPQPFQSNLMSALRSALNGEGHNKLAVVGPSGQGKSALMASVAQQLATEQEAVLLPHFIGADGSSDLANWRDRVIAFAQSFGQLTTELPQNNEERWANLYAVLAEAQMKAGKPLLLVLDAINQCIDPEDSERRLQSMTLPPQVVLLISSISLQETEDWQTYELPVLDEGMQRRVIDAYLTQHSKKLPSPIIAQLAAGESTRNPLFLKLLLEELRLHALHEDLEQMATRLLQHQDAGALFVDCLQQLDQDFASSGGALGSRAARLLACSRAGLGMHDLAVLLGESSTHDATTRLPDVVMLPLMARLAPFTFVRDGRLCIMHTILQQSLLGHQESVKLSRQKIAGYFVGGDDFSLAERVCQWLFLGDRNLISELKNVKNLLRIHGSFKVIFIKIEIFLRENRDISDELLAAWVDNAKNNTRSFYELTCANRLFTFYSIPGIGNAIALLLTNQKIQEGDFYYAKLLANINTLSTEGNFQFLISSLEQAHLGKHKGDEFFIEKCSAAKILIELGYIDAAKHLLLDWLANAQKIPSKFFPYIAGVFNNLKPKIPRDDAEFINKLYLKTSRLASRHSNNCHIAMILKYCAENFLLLDDFSKSKSCINMAIHSFKKNMLDHADDIVDCEIILAKNHIKENNHIEAMAIVANALSANKNIQHYIELSRIALDLSINKNDCDEAKKISREASAVISKLNEKGYFEKSFNGCFCVFLALGFLSDALEFYRSKLDAKLYEENLKIWHSVYSTRFENQSHYIAKLKELADINAAIGSLGEFNKISKKINEAMNYETHESKKKKSFLDMHVDRISSGLPDLFDMAVNPIRQDHNNEFMKLVLFCCNLARWKPSSRFIFGLKMVFKTKKVALLLERIE